MNVEFTSTHDGWYMNEAEISEALAFVSPGTTRVVFRTPGGRSVQVQKVSRYGDTVTIHVAN